MISIEEKMKMDSAKASWISTITYEYYKKK